MKRLLLLSLIFLLIAEISFPQNHVKTASVSTASSTTCTITVTLAAGNAAVVTLLFNSSVAGLGGEPNQTAGDTLTKRAGIDNGGTYQEQLTNYSVAGGSTTFTFTWTNASTSLIYVTEISGLSNPAFDQSASTNQTTATTHSSGTTGTLVQANNIVIATFDGNGSGNTGNISMSNSYIIPTNGNMFGAGIAGERGLLAYLITSSTAAAETTMTSDNVIATGLIGVYKGSRSTQGISKRTKLRRLGIQ